MPQSTITLPSSDLTFPVKVVLNPQDEVIAIWGLDQNMVMLDRNQAARLRDIINTWLDGGIN